VGGVELRSIFIFLTLTILGGCQPTDKIQLAVDYSTQTAEVERSDFTAILEAHNVASENATLIIKRLSDGQRWSHNVPRSIKRFRPASTSKIPHTLIALEQGYATPNTLFEWDGTPQYFKSWEQDMTLKQAYKKSAVWVFKKITSDLGHTILAEELERLNYGNHEIGTWEDLTSYWLLGPLEISAEEQINFLTQLARETLPLSGKTYENAKSIFKYKQRPTQSLYAKTGWMKDGVVTDYGWYVGWVEDRRSEKEDTYVFALHMDILKDDESKKRIPIVLDSLDKISAWPKDP